MLHTRAAYLAAQTASRSATSPPCTRVEHTSHLSRKLHITLASCMLSRRPRRHPRGVCSAFVIVIPCTRCGDTVPTVAPAAGPPTLNLYVITRPREITKLKPHRDPRLTLRVGYSLHRTSFALQFVLTCHHSASPVRQRILSSHLRHARHSCATRPDHTVPCGFAPAPGRLILHISGLSFASYTHAHEHAAPALCGPGYTRLSIRSHASSLGPRSLGFASYTYARVQVTSAPCGSGLAPSYMLASTQPRPLRPRLPPRVRILARACSLGPRGLGFASYTRA